MTKGEQGVDFANFLLKIGSYTHLPLDKVCILLYNKGECLYGGGAAMYESDEYGLIRTVLSNIRGSTAMLGRLSEVRLSHLSELAALQASKESSSEHLLTARHALSALCTEVCTGEISDIAEQSVGRMLSGLSARDIAELCTRIPADVKNAMVPDETEFDLSDSSDLSNISDLSNLSNISVEDNTPLWDLSNDNILFSDVGDMSRLRRPHVCKKIVCFGTAVSKPAFDRFATVLEDAEISYVDDFRSACEDVYNRFADACILPIMSSEDGVMTSFLRLARQFELHAHHVCTVSVGEGRQTLVGLFGREMPPTDGAEYLDLFVSVRDGRLCDLLSGYDQLGAVCEIVTALPRAMFEEENYFVSLLVKDADAAALIAFSRLLVPSVFVGGLYKKVPETAQNAKNKSKQT